MKVAIDAQILPGVTGGIAVAVKSLLQGLGQLEGPEKYVVVIDSEEQRAWLAPFLGTNHRLVMRPRPQPTRARRLLSRIAHPVVRVLRGFGDGGSSGVPVSGGFHESLGCDVLHFPTQSFIRCAVPTVYNPHDLQHLQYPQYFSPRLLAWREAIYPAGCHHAHTVVVGSQWVKEDVVRRYRIDPDKIQVIAEAAPTQTSGEPTAADLERVRAAYQLDAPFLLFPGVTWAHKNHLRLFEALARLRDGAGVRLNLICTGSRYPSFWPRIEAGLRQYGLDGQVRFLGYVPDGDLRGLYRLASCLVFPSLYEASSLPIFEAWLDGLPVACSNATALPEQVRDAAVLFDPTDVGAIADAIVRITTNADLRRDLRTRGYERLKDFDLLRTAKAYRAVYRRAGGFPLSDEDRWLLGWDWMSGTHQGEEGRSPEGPGRTHA
jgi:glycosyltransferase involved in cell wall biosynthesis